MAALLNDLELLADQHPEVQDTDVRERLWALVDAQLLQQQSEVEVPCDLGMFTQEGNLRLQQLMSEHLSRLRDVFSVFDLNTPEQRKSSFFNLKLRSSRNGLSIEDFFGAP